MGEIRIKSGNLANGELEQGGISVSGDIVTSSARVYGYAYVKSQTAYTIASNKAFRLCYGYNDDGTSISKVGRIFDNNSGNNKLKTFTTPEGCNYIRFAMWNGDESDIIPTDIQNLILVEGTYTSSTIPEYQPYFLNRPAHKFTNGQWIDIPTHKYTNGRWQGELTSQSPLRFRADGEMLDWRIEGKTSGNLFDGELEQGSLNSNDGSEVVNNTRVRTVGNTLLKEGTYTINCAGATGGVVVCAYNTDDLSYDKAASYVGQWRSLPFTFVVDNERLYRFAFKKANDSVIVPSEITDIQLLEGTYTASTLPPYEVSIYTDHQLMDGDSIDYTTTETTIPLATGNNTLTVDTAVQPKSVFVKFEG